MEKYRTTEYYQLKNIAGQIMLFPVGAKASVLQGAIALNELSAFVWQELREAKTLDEVIRAIEENYDTEGEDVREHIIPLLESFEAYEVIVVNPV